MVGPGSGRAQGLVLHRDSARWEGEKFWRQMGWWLHIQDNELKTMELDTREVVQ